MIFFSYNTLWFIELIYHIQSSQNTMLGEQAQFRISHCGCGLRENKKLI